MASTITIPRRLPILLVQDNVLLPGSSMRISVRSVRNMNMVKNRLLSRSTISSTIIGVSPKDSDEGDELSDIHQLGTAAVVVQVTGTNWPRPAYTLLVTGLCRFKVDELLQETPYLVARVTQLDKLPGEEIGETLKDNDELNLLAGNFRESASKLVDMLDVSVPVVAKLKNMLGSLPNHQLPDVCASIVKASFAEKLEILEAVDLMERFKKTLPLLMRQIEGMNLLENSKKNALELKHKQKRLNLKNAESGDDDGDDISDFEKKIKAANLPEHALKAAMKELKRLKKMPQQMPEHGMIRNYLELMVDLPWSKSSKDTLDIVKARKHLDTDHYGLEQLKKRVLEYLAVRQLKNSLKGPILCFVGPPGVGKTSVGKSIATTLGREFHRISLGGTCDQSDIRGHRRTYVGSMPGRIIQGLKTVGVNNPVFLLDEIDKLGNSLHGDPAAALLEVLDPEQNNTFTDHYLNVPFDLSQVLFIATANSVQGIPGPLVDRMEMITVHGYTEEEKIHIANGYLLEKQYAAHGLTNDQVQIPEPTVRKIVSSYTREAGVRSLERNIAAVCRAVAVRVAEAETGKILNYNTHNKSDSDKHMVHDTLKDHENQVAKDSSHPPEMPYVIDETALEDILGPTEYENEMLERLSRPGVAIGLAWTAVGGQIMFVEASKMLGEGEVSLTGQLGDVMKESAMLALSWLRTHSRELELGNAVILDKTDVHIHFPAGAISKDGPSAGVTIATVLVSLFCDRCVRSDTAMTGEVTLRGQVLPVGGIKEKLLAAHRAGVRRVIIPRRNKKDLHKLPDDIRKEMSFILASRLEDVLNAAFDNGFPSLPTQDVIPSKL